MTTVDVIVLGTGTAAQTVAYTCREAGRSVAVVDYHPYGGTCQLRGCDPKKVLVPRDAQRDENERAIKDGEVLLSGQETRDESRKRLSK